MDLLVVDISEKTYISILENIGLYASMTSGLNASVYNWENAKGIAQELDIDLEDESDICQYFVDVEYKKDEEDFFLDYFTDVVKGIVENNYKKAEHELTVFFNLSYFSAGLTKFNKMVKALFNSNGTANKKSIEELPIDNFIFFVGSVTQLIDSDVFLVNKDITDGPRHNIYVIDNDGDVGISNNIDPNKKDVIDLDKFEIYNTSEDRIRVEFENDCFKYLGHFILPTIHLRTYYDLGMFVKRDDVFYYYFKIFKKIIAENSNVLLCGIGYQEGNLNVLALRLKRMAQKFRNINIVYCFQEDINNYDLSRFEQIILLCDVVNSGDTVGDFISQNIDENNVTIMTVAAMSNSPSSVKGIDIYSGIKLNSNHLGSLNEKCYLCKYDQEPTQISSFEDFRRIKKDKLTPLDFWEIVKSSDAFIRSSFDYKNRRLCYRIDTSKIIEKYKCFLTKTIWSAFRNNFGRAPIDAILTVDKESSLDFANLVATSIKGYDIEIIKIKREMLGRITPSSGLPDGNPLVNKHKVLIVDTGINRGGTLHRLINYSNAANANTIGALIFDNRIDEVSLQRLTRNLKGEIVTLYDWVSMKKDTR